MYNLNQFLKNTIQFKNSTNPSNIHIGYGIDNNYARCCATSITSFCLNNPKQNFTFHLMANDLTTTTKVKFDELAKLYSTNIFIYELDTSKLSSLPTQTHLPISTYFRFILPLILKDIDKLYYVDADIICLQNADELFNISLNNNIIAAVPDLPWMNNKRNKALNLNNHTYFNAGMLVIDIIQWNKFNTFEKVLQAIQLEPQKFRYLDQDALNLILTKYIEYIDKKFNCIDLNTINHQDIILLHFAAHPKPWNIAFPISKVCNTFNKNLYAYYENQTPWKNTPLEQPKNYKEIKIYAKALKNNKQYIKSLYYFSKYLMSKI